ncbi:MAG TPA: peptide chain release factor N(5)-glutamine methyltransferase [Myxococcaceae bacterium]|nr:peptide chain release factor N(5)-glutamine methyltransferase [Myxococcaceae bacterium]
MSEGWTVRSVLGWTTEYFNRRSIDAPRLTAEVLLAQVMRGDRVQLYIDLDRPLSRAELRECRGLIERRAAGEPTQYLTGKREFYGRPFAVDPRVFIPRPETESVVERVLQEIPKESERRILDLCTGSGCIAVTIAAERPKSPVVATELSAEACEVARANAAALGVADRVRILQGDLFAPLEPGAPFDVLVSNPPYIASGEIPALSAEVRREPALALDGGTDGLEVTRRLAAQACQWLRPGGFFAVEIGDQAGAPVLRLFQAAGFVRTEVGQDFAQLDRMVFGYKS